MIVYYLISSDDRFLIVSSLFSNNTDVVIVVIHYRVPTLMWGGGNPHGERGKQEGGKALFPEKGDL